MSVSNGEIPGDEEKTIFTSLMAPFPEPKDEQTNTVQFLEASKGVVALVDKLGKIFAPVRYDMNGNITKLELKYESNREKFVYIEDMILSDRTDLVTIDALQWLRRGLHFMLRFIECVLRDTEEKPCLSICLKKAYRETLEEYHGWMGSQLFNIMCRFSPTRNDFFSILALNNHDRNSFVIRDLVIFLANLRKCVLHLVEFYKTHNLELHGRI